MAEPDLLFGVHVIFHQHYEDSPAAHSLIAPKDGILLLALALIRLQQSMPLVTTRMACTDERLMSRRLAGASDFVAL
ncbi:MAG: hypothetical protein Fur005_26250 [Roseiflexaceae bacterium]